MKKFLVCLVMALMISSSLVLAVKMPKNAKEVSPGVFNLGKSLHKGKLVEGYAIINYKEGHAKPNGAVCGNGVCEKGENSKKCPADCGSSEPDTASCYGFMARGAKWKTVEPYVVNPINSRGLDEIFVASNMELDISKWESAAGKDIIGTSSTTFSQLVADTANPDGLNEVYFGSIDEPGAIAITIVWGIFGGAPKNRELFEWDQVYDEVDFDWSASGESLKMDFESIATHELGHSLGLDDLYTSECSSQTMYGYASEGETKSRTLEAGDIKGASELYK